MEFPGSLFPSFYSEGPCAREAPSDLSVFGFGGHGTVEPSNSRQDGYKFIPLYTRTAERWKATGPAPIPLLPPNHGREIPPVFVSDIVQETSKRVTMRNTLVRKSKVQLDFTKQLGNFSLDHSDTAFQCMGQLLEPHCYLGDKDVYRQVRLNTKKMTGMLQSLRHAVHRDCPFSYSDSQLRCLSFLACDWLQDIPPAMLAQRVHQGLADEWRQLQYNTQNTGGALSYAAYPQGHYGCLIFPQGEAMNELHFQQVKVNVESGGHTVKILEDPAVFELNGRIQQVSSDKSGSSEEVLVGVRSNYHLASWKFSSQDPPRSLQVINTQSPSTCINVSPYLPGELCVCTEHGGLYLWNVETGLNLLRNDSDTLFFRDDLDWRWGDYTSHPRVLTYADRTGVQSVDIRVPDAQGLDIFRIGQEASCQRGERVILPRCLREENPAHCLITTQFSVYIMDERFPLVPLLKWDHMFQSPPSFAQIIPCRQSSRSNKVVLGSQRGETLMLQYTGGTLSPLQMLFPTLSVPQPSQCLAHLPPLQPLHHDYVAQRLASPGAGLAAAHMTSDQDSIMVFSLTDPGDLFYQTLVHQPPDSPEDSDQGEGQRHPTHQHTSAHPLSNHNAESISTHEEGQTVPGDGSTESLPVQDRTICSLSSQSDPNSQNGSAHEANGAAQSTNLQTENRTGISHLSSKSLRCLQRWLRALNQELKPKGPSRPKFGIKKFLKSLEVSESDSGKSVSASDELRRTLLESMRHGNLVQLNTPLVSGALEPVCPQTWKDPLSQRLTAAWNGQLGFWWEDYLGLNRQSKVQSLRERRRRQKLQRARSCSRLSGSFTSSLSLDSSTYDQSSAWSVYSEPLSEPEPIPTGSKRMRSPPPDHQSSWTDTQESMDATETQHRELGHKSWPEDGNSQTPNDSSSLLSSQSLNFRGIPRERRKTVRDFISLLGNPSEPQTHARNAPASSFPSQTISLSQQSQSLSQRSQSRSQQSKKRPRMGF
ncbi:TATA box-binding protein-associated factor, RNA polymerase I, subunit C [Xenopus laevis]|uniref:TATA box-binding protein-associated factor, RNA polymerase I, subunit C n=2 Tax=Xenopus laevis TaxID=8355 RepID=A0A310TQ02_XENLA|nr:TATA box-binding protein-associated factor, RNA polymerase I, subunit C [Xenopus laevis]XP_041436659.1 TATA box-binding protein-associated factor, RNA polymerase I, subunit C [Xenopus laevis]OCT56908.1 hypothetical protein XELAEV_18004213mg [Xenopus laevis]